MEESSTKDNQSNMPYMVPMECYAEKKKSQPYGQKSTGAILYRKKYFALLADGWILAYFNKKRVA
jgi:hypothetical protein